MEEAELIAGCRRGDRSAQRAVYERHADRVYRIALRLTRNEQDAFDVAQETFVRAFERIDSFDGRSRMGTWLYRIATNEALQLFRKRDTERRHLRVVSEQQEDATRPESEAARQEVDDALEHLSEEHRAILILRYQEALRYDEIADVLEIAPGTVASRLNRARAELRRLLGNPGTEREEDAPHPHPTDDEGRTEQGPATAG
jgi:RNA polymerase sigma-70 factor (ECF subfamily)